MKKLTIGIIGGMGPLATADLFTKMIRATDSPNDAGHIHIIVDNDPSIPDRTESILRGGASPVEAIIRSAKLLRGAGCELLVMPCNAAHYYIQSIRDSVDIPVLDMISLTADHLKSQRITRAALFAAEGTVKTGIYSRACAERGIELLIPDESLQREVTGVIYDGIKAGRDEYDVTALQRGIDELISRGAQTVILGCTELPLAVTQYDLKGSFTDPTLVLAKSAVEEAGYKAL